MRRDPTPLPAGWPEGPWRERHEELPELARQRAAHHEAAHAAAYLFVGVVPTDLIITPGGGGQVRVPPAALRRLDAETRAVALFAGMAAEVQSGNAAPWQPGTADVETVRAIAAAAGLGVEWACDLAWRRARSLVGDRQVRLAIALIAKRLLREGALSGPRWHATAFEAAAIMRGRWRCAAFSAWPGAREAGVPRRWVPPERPDGRGEGRAGAPPPEPAFRLLARAAPELRAAGLAAPFAALALLLALAVALGPR